jgi:hypothetical protein
VFVADAAAAAADDDDDDDDDYRDRCCGDDCASLVFSCVALPLQGVGGQQV